MNRPGKVKPSGHDGVTVGLIQLKLPIVTTRAHLAAQTQRLCELIGKARRRERKLQLLAFPEYSLHGLSMNTDAHLMCRRDGIEVTSFRAACREHRLWGCFSILEYNPHGNPFNAGIVIDDTGEIRIHYRKLRPWSPAEPWQPGNLDISVCDGPNGSRLSLIICNDGMFPEIAHECSQQGANLLIRLSGYTAPLRQAWRASNQQNAMNNLMASASVSLADGSSMMNARGAAMIVNYDGVSLAEGNGLDDEMITAEVRPDLIDAARLAAGIDDGLLAFGERNTAAAIARNYTNPRDVGTRRYLLPWEGRLRIEGDDEDALLFTRRRSGAGG